MKHTEETVHVTVAREAAYFALFVCESKGAWADQALRNASQKYKLDQRDAALAAQLCYGVMQNRILLDFWIDQFSSIQAAKLDIPVRIALRIALYQLHFLTKIPASAAVNESVNLVLKYSNRGAAGLTNAVLHSFQRANPCPQPSEDDLSTRYSHPAELVRLLSEEVGGDAEPLLKANNETADMCIQVNTLKTTSSALFSALKQMGADVFFHPWLQDCLLMKSGGNIEYLPAFQGGLFYVQDAAARLAVIASGVKSGDCVLDACAAPGGKSFAAAIQMGNVGKILSRDVYENKLKRICDGADRLGIHCIQTDVADAQDSNCILKDSFDVVLADVPCSGFGVIRRKPDIRYKNLRETEMLPAIQLKILNNLANGVRIGGILLYSTCTVLRRENEEVIEAFLHTRQDFHLEPFVLPQIGLTSGQITLWPHINHTDGFFIAKLRRTDGNFKKRS